MLDEILYTYEFSLVYRTLIITFYTHKFTILLNGTFNYQNQKLCSVQLETLRNDGIKRQNYGKLSAAFAAFSEKMSHFKSSLYSLYSLMSTSYSDRNSHREVEYTQ